MINPIAIAIPFFLVCIAAEVGWSTWRGQRLYRLNIAVSDLMCGVSSQLTGLVTKVVSVGAYVFVHSQFALFSIEGTLPVWILSFLAVDLAYYAWHRWTHSMNFGWASHVVHHQSEDYNLAVALRQSMTSTLTSWPFYLPLALLGVPPVVALTCIALNTLYQFWIHTELIRTLGPLEWVLNTPSHHRVHHGIQPQYLDRNHAGVLIVWDRMFGTFEPEVEPPVYGTVKKLEALDPLWANLWWMQRMFETAVRTPAVSDKLGVLWRGPGFAPSGSPPVPVRAEALYDPQGAPGVGLYTMLHFPAIALLTTWILWVPREVSVLAGPVTLVFLACLTLPTLFERQARGWWLEWARLLGTVLWAFFVSPLLGIVALLGALASGVWLWSAR